VVCFHLPVCQRDLKKRTEVSECVWEGAHHFFALRLTADAKIFLYVAQTKPWRRVLCRILLELQNGHTNIFLCSIISGAHSISCEFICIHFKDFYEECRKATEHLSFSVCQFMPLEPFFAFATVVGMQCFIIMHFCRVAVWAAFDEAFFSRCFTSPYSRFSLPTAHFHIHSPIHSNDF